MPTDVNLRAASALLFHAEAPAEWGHESVSSFIAFLQANRAPVAVLPPVRELAARDASGALDAYVQREEERYKRQLTAYVEVARAWSAHGIEAVLIKSPGYFPYTSSNVDVLVATGHAHDAGRILESLGYAELRIAREPHKRLFRRVDPPYVGFPIHLHTAVAWVNRFLTDEQVLHQRRHNHDCPLLLHPSSDNVFLITTAHWLYEDKMLALRDLYHASLGVEDGVDWNAVRRGADRAGWRPGLEFALALYRSAADRFGAVSFREALPASQVRGRLLRRELARSTQPGTAPVPLSKPLWKAMHAVKTLSDRDLSTAAKVCEVSAVAWFAVGAKIPSQRNGPFLAVSVSGPDGAGKTTLARGLQQWLEQDPSLKASYHWERIGTSRALDLLKTAGAAIRGGGSGRERSRPPTASDETKLFLQAHPHVRRAWSYVLLADFLGRRYVQRIHGRMVGGIHILDRDAIDAAVDLESIYCFPNAALAVALAPRPAVQLLIEPASAASAAGFPAAAAYRDYAARADAVMTAHEPLGSLIDSAGRLVLRSLVAAGSSRGP
jgi:hypothetical protein